MVDHALHELGSESGDKHIEDLAKRVREIDSTSDHDRETEAVQHELEKVASGEATGEELEKN